MVFVVCKLIVSLWDCCYCCYIDNECLSLMCMVTLQIVMEFRKCGDKDDQRVDVLLPRFSVAIMSDEARYAWTHGITPHLSDIIRESDSTDALRRLTLMKRGVRTSLTFRNVRHSAVCQCSMYFQCSIDQSYCLLQIS